MKYRNLLVAGAAAMAITLSGCAAMAEAGNKAAGLGQITQERSSFDGATIIQASPHFLYNSEKPMMSATLSAKLGARWSSKTPDLVYLVVRYDAGFSGPSFTNIRGVDINIGGQVSQFDAGGLTNHSSSGYNTVAGTVFTASENGVVIPLELLRKMISAPDCRVRIRTMDGYEDATFSVDRIPGGQTTAKASLGQLLSAIEAGGVIKK